ncbi:ATP-binding protein [bacterium]|nr:ATP-binding protein [bacterium]
MDAINKFIIDRKSEELFLDFKRSADSGKGNKLHDNDRNNLAKAISGFGNSEGGVIVWGIDCSKDIDNADVAKAKFPIENVDKFISFIQSSISRSTLPPHSNVECYGIKEKDSSGYVITHIPKSNHAPHQCIFGSNYYMRAGSAFVPVPHGILEGMFGKRPQPLIYFNFITKPPKITKTPEEQILIKTGFLIRNEGLGIARDVFMNAEIISLPGSNCAAKFEAYDTINWIGNMTLGYKLGLICKESFRLPPKNWAQPVNLNILLKRPFTKAMKIKLMCGCEGAEHYETVFGNPEETIEKYYSEMLNADNQDIAQNLVQELLNFKEQ